MVIEKWRVGEKYEKKVYVICRNSKVPGVREGGGPETYLTQINPPNL